MVDWRLGSALGKDLGGEDLLERRHAAGIFTGRADGDANELRERVAAHRARDDAAFLQLFEYCLPIADFHEDEIRRGRNVVEVHLAKFAREEVQALRVVLARAAKMFVIVERRERASLDERIDVERLADFFERGDELGMTDAITEAQTREAIDLRESSQQDEVRFKAEAHERQQVNWVVQEFQIRFVHHQQDRGWQLVDQTDDIAARGE